MQISVIATKHLVIEAADKNNPTLVKFFKQNSYHQRIVDKTQGIKINL